MWKMASKMKAAPALCILAAAMAASTANAAPCQVHPVRFEGWQAQQMSNDWLQLTFVPQLGGRLMQVAFNGHPYLFVNPVYKGKYISPTEAAGRWINYGGDKIWPLPEGNDDEQHWQGASTPLDDGAYAFSVLSQDARCTVRLEGPPDPPTGLQYTREISIGSDSPEISFHAITKNYTGHSITWAVQSVSKYNLSDANDPKEYNHKFWAITPVNPSSSYLLGYHVRDGLANDPSFSVENGLFRLSWKYLESEVWLDSVAGWVALIDGSTQYAMVERSNHIAGGDYPSRATTIFYKNGPMLRMNEKGVPYVPSTTLDETPYYMEAELNSPMVALGPGQTYAFDTHWFPSRLTSDFTTVTDAGLVGKPLAAHRSADKLELSGTFGVFFPGELKAFLYGDGGLQVGQTSLLTVQPQDLIALHQTIAVPANVDRVSIHVVDSGGVDRGALGEVFVTINEERH
jgi:hypothetical protein